MFILCNKKDVLIILGVLVPYISSLSPIKHESLMVFISNYFVCMLYEHVPISIVILKSKQSCIVRSIQLLNLRRLKINMQYPALYPIINNGKSPWNERVHELLPIQISNLRYQLSLFLGLVTTEFSITSYKSFC